ENPVWSSFVPFALFSRLRLSPPVYNFPNQKRKFSLRTSQYEEGEDMMAKSPMILLIFLLSILLVSAQEPRSATSGSLRQIIPGHYVYSTTSGGRVFSSGVIVTSEGALVFDALDSETIARA